MTDLKFEIDKVAVIINKQYQEARKEYEQIEQLAKENADDKELMMKLHAYASVIDYLLKAKNDIANCTENIRKAHNMKVYLKMH